VTSIEQVAATPDAAHRRRLQRVRVLVVPPAGEAPGAAALIAALARQPGVGWDDALIAAAAAAQSAPLVTEDRALREAAGALLPRLEVWGWADGLRPRLEALAQD
jgi:predicted nucleic acid-binding protein